MKVRYQISVPPLFPVLILCIWNLSCETTFEPLQENDLYAFTMYGSLDLHAETQWVRVMPIGETLIYKNPEPNGTKVSLIRESTGEMTALNDSLFRFGGDAYVWNYWAGTTLQPNEEYRVVAETTDGRKSQSVVTLPSFLPIPDVTYSVEEESGTVSGSTEDPLVTVEMRYLAQAITEVGCAQEMEVIISHLDDVFITPEGEYHFDIDNRFRIASGLGGNVPYIVNKRELVVISASEEDWPDIADLTEEEIILPDLVSNVENGTGVIAGIATRRVIITPRRPACEN